MKVELGSEAKLSEAVNPDSTFKQCQDLAMQYSLLYIDTQSTANTIGTYSDEYIKLD